MTFIYSFIFILVCLFSWARYADLSMLCLTDSSPWYTLFTFHFLHTQPHHLAVNIFLFIFYWRYIRNSNYIYTIPIIILAATAAACMARYSTPTQGCSAVVMAMAGILIATLSKKLRRKNMAIFAIMFAITAAVPHINAAIHAYALLIAFTLTRIAGNKRICRQR